ncbi:MAG: hypothetical protein M3N53_01780 [Actinomycetota bacterium]|nr:hypothetical protein [Actinomycetota bacterium]
MRTSLVVRTLLAIALSAALLPATGGTAAAASCGGSTATVFRTFYVTAKPHKKTYPLGDVVKVDITVTRPAHEDPVGAGVTFEPPASLPAADVDVSVGLYLGNNYLYGLGVTDSNGEATVSIKLNASQTGWVLGEIAAREFYNRGGCPDIEEEGYVSYPKFFKATL